MVATLTTCVFTTATARAIFGVATIVTASSFIVRNSEHYSLYRDLGVQWNTPWGLSNKSDENRFMKTFSVLGVDLQLDVKIALK
ncbi:hypothetical protein RRG08_047874 [Elysia crispata]|uniref:Uncharacterized protein n=1 Tax=Elysia crispata TaxID=231223 RepID=A0AAE1DID1_9GAST|nr:hypothetical protein RRG08_047874 [Elysia crispata]